MNLKNKDTCLYLYFFHSNILHIQDYGELQLNHLAQRKCCANCAVGGNRYYSLGCSYGDNQGRAIFPPTPSAPYKNRVMTSL